VSDVLARIEDWDVTTVAVGVAGPDGVRGTHGPTDQPLPLASVTKLLTAYAVLVAVQDGVVHLDEPAGPTAEAGGTVRHLLAHAAGLPFDRDAPTQTPEKRRVYSNWGYEVLGELVAERVGLPFAEHLRIEVLEPLGMDHTSLEGSPAADARGTVDDLLAFVGEVLRPRLLEPALVEEARSVAFPGLNGVLPGFGRQSPNDWGLGFEVRGGKAPHWTGERLSEDTAGHFGQSGSFLWFEPETEVGCVLLGDRDFGAWAKRAWPPFTDAVHEEFT
jgi:CubicO group peptidase (beta-lactamase class C family)